MSGADCLLDTNAVIAWNSGEMGMARLISSFGAPRIPLMVAGELTFGARNSRQLKFNMEVVAENLRAFPILLPNEETRFYYAQVRFQRHAKGRPIPENDVWIAALAIQHNLPLVSRDQHFHEVEGLTVQSW